MARDGSDGTGPARLIEALDVVRNAKLGFGVGVGLAALAYAVRVGELLGPARAGRASPTLFLLLAVVLAVSAGALLTTALTARSAIRLAREADADADPDPDPDADPDLPE